mmetsp:Transcript_1453/g.2101  ORF Transcript_1453/g.2101 Transcript_1453/m.2101 type:complete len:155 (+) Transcript_1453:213-677(+)
MFSNSYDSCRVPAFTADPESSTADYMKAMEEAEEYCMQNIDACIEGTQWSAAFAFNATVLFLSAINFIGMAVGGCFWWPRMYGAYINFCYACCHCSAFSFALGVRFNPVGNLCVFNIAPSEYKGEGKWDDTMTYQKDGELLGALASIQALFWAI